MLWNQIQEVCVKFPLVEVPVTLDGLKNGVGCDKAHDVQNLSQNYLQLVS